MVSDSCCESGHACYHEADGHFDEAIGPVDQNILRSMGSLYRLFYSPHYPESYGIPGHVRMVVARQPKPKAHTPDNARAGQAVLAVPTQNKTESFLFRVLTKALS